MVLEERVDMKRPTYQQAKEMSDYVWTLRVEDPLRGDIKERLKERFGRTLISNCGFCQRHSPNNGTDCSACVLFWVSAKPEKHSVYKNNLPKCCREFWHYEYWVKKLT